MNPITIPNISIPTIGIPTIGIPSVGFPSASGGGLVWPAGMKEHIKAIYDPAKQGMTNYDVIESYAEDFTTWKYHTDRATLVITANTLNITNVKTGTNNLIEDNVEPFSDLVIKVTGVSNEAYLLVRNANSLIQTIKTDGVYKVSSNNKYIAFAVNKTGECNITITQLSTSILKDLSGNGNHAYLYGGKGKLNSGMGVYQTDFSSWNYYPSLSTVEYSPKGLVIKKVNSTAQFCASDFVGKFTAEVSGIPEGVSFYYRYIDKTTGSPVSTTLSNGINEIDCSNANGDANMTNMFLIGADNKDINITITQIPDYPDQLCYDGKMYAVCYGFPILEDYTVMADRTWFDIRSVSCFIGKRNRSGDNLGAFEFEFRANQALSFGRTNSIIFADSGIVYQTKNSYNGIGIESGLLDDTDVLIIGAAQQNINNKPQDIYIGCHGKIIIADRSFTEDEITWLKDNWKKI